MLNPAFRTLFFIFWVLCLLKVDLYSEFITIRYDLKIDINYQDEKLSGLCTLSFKKSGDEDTLPVLLYRLLKVNSVTDIDGKPLSYTQNVLNFSDFELVQANYVRINTGKAETVIIKYEGYILGYAETGMNYIKDQINSQFTIIRNDCLAYPVISDPSFSSLRASLSNKFDYKISVTVPDSLYAVNGGKLVSKETIGGITVFTYRNIKPSWRIDISIAKYKMLNDSNISVYYFPEDSSGAEILIKYAVNSYNLYTKWFGKIENPGFSIIEIPDGWGSQTDVSCIIQTAAAFKDINNIDEVYHEISHLWNVSSTDSIPCRLESEGLATFLQFFVKEKLNNRPGLTDSLADNLLKLLQKKIEKVPAFMEIPMIDFGKNIMTNFSYTKGMLFYYLFYKISGEQKFLKVIDGFYQKYRKTGASTDEFVNLLIEQTGNKSIKHLSNDWIYTAHSSELILKSNGITEIVDYYKNNK